MVFRVSLCYLDKIDATAKKSIKSRVFGYWMWFYVHPKQMLFKSNSPSIYHFFGWLRNIIANILSVQ